MMSYIIKKIPDVPAFEEALENIILSILDDTKNKTYQIELILPVNIKIDISTNKKTKDIKIVATIPKSYNILSQIIINMYSLFYQLFIFIEVENVVRERTDSANVIKMDFKFIENELDINVVRDKAKDIIGVAQKYYDKKVAKLAEAADNKSPFIESEVINKDGEANNPAA